MKLSDMSTVKYNGVELSEVRYNGISVWTAGIRYQAKFYVNGSPWNTQTVREGGYCAIPPAPDIDSFAGWTDEVNGYAIDFDKPIQSDLYAGAILGTSGRIGGQHFRTVENCNVQSKVCLVRVDFNYTDEADMPEYLARHVPTVKAILSGGGTVGLLSGRGKPKGQVVEAYSLKDCVAPLSRLLETEVGFSTDLNDFLRRISDRQEPVCLLENVEFFPQEVKSTGQEDFSKLLASCADIFVQDMTRQLGTNRPSVAGAAALVGQYRLSEVVLGLYSKNPCESAHTLAEGNLERPYAAVVGGSFQDKYSLLARMAMRVDLLLLGGEIGIMANAVAGREIGAQNYGTANLEQVAEIMHLMQQNGVTVVLPVDYKVADSFDSRTYEVVGSDAIRQNHCLLDIGPETMKLFCSRLNDFRTVFWMGAMSTTTQPRYGGGLFMAQTVPYRGLTTAVCGSEAVSLCKQLGNTRAFGDVLDSVFAKYLGGEVIAGLEVIQTK